MKFKTILLIFFIFLSTTTFAQKYVGFEMCKKTSINKIIDFIERTGAIDINQEEVKYNYIVIHAKNYPIENGLADISVGVADGILNGISIKIKDQDNEIGIFNIMKNKYGEPDLMIAQSTTNIYEYKSKDPKIQIIGAFGKTIIISYGCKSIKENKNQGLRKNNAGHPL